MRVPKLLLQFANHRLDALGIATLEKCAPGLRHHNPQHIVAQKRVQPVANRQGCNPPGTIDQKQDAVVALILTDNPVMGDGKTMFHADHNNVVTSYEDLDGKLDRLEFGPIKDELEKQLRALAKRLKDMNRYYEHFEDEAASIRK